MKCMFPYLIAAALCLNGCASASAASSVPVPSADVPAIVLVHVAFQDARAWDRVAPLLLQRGLRAVAVNRPRHDGDGADPHSITLEGYRDMVPKTIEAQPGQVVLIGHSFGGIAISNAAEAVPDRIRALFYVAAYLPEVDAADDNAASNTFQQRMVARSAVLRTVMLDTGHSPCLKAPEALAEAIAGAAR